MKSDKGVTLISLIIYILMFTIVIGIMAYITSTLISNVDIIRQQESYAPEFNKFNMFFIEDVKGNSLVTVAGKNITFEDGTQYTYSSTKQEISRDGVVIAKSVVGITYTVATETVESVNKTILTVNIKMANGSNVFEEQIDYVLKYW